MSEQMGNSLPDSM